MTNVTSRTHGEASGEKGRTCRRAGRLGIHPHEVQAFARELIEVGSLDAHDVIHLRVPHLPETYIIDEDVENVGALAVILLADRGKRLVNVLVLGVPLVAVLGAEVVVFAVMNDITSVDAGGHGNSYDSEDRLDGEQVIDLVFPGTTG